MTPPCVMLLTKRVPSAAAVKLSGKGELAGSTTVAGGAATVAHPAAAIAKLSAIASRAARTPTNAGRLNFITHLRQWGSGNRSGKAGEDQPTKTPPGRAERRSLILLELIVRCRICKASHHELQCAGAHRLQVAHRRRWTWRRCSEAQRTVRKGRKNSRISCARISGCSSAAKWPPFGCVVQRRMSLYSRAATERGGRRISRGNST